MSNLHHFASKEEYKPLESVDIGKLSQNETLELLKKTPAVAEMYSNDPDVGMDNRDAIRLLLKLRRIEPPLFELIVTPYDNGYYKKCDGKSTPLSFMKVPRFLRLFGFWKDVVSVRHDYDYYRGTDQQEADRRYREGQIQIGQRAWIAIVEYYTLRLFGRFSWNGHKKRRERIDGYGSDEYIESLPNKKGYRTSNYVWFSAVAVASYFGAVWYSDYISPIPPFLPEAYKLIPATLTMLAFLAGISYLWKEWKTGRWAGIKKQTILGIGLSALTFFVHLAEW